MEKYGDIAQLGERLTGSQEVRGSSPLISTKREKRGNNILFFYSISYAVFITFYIF